MKESFLVSLKEKMVAKSSKPWACFETEGVTEEGLGVAMHWNKAFIQKLHSQGIQGSNDNETIQLFFLFMSSRVADGVTGSEDVVSPEATPNLTREANRFVR
jgi:hypothetical protein